MPLIVQILNGTFGTGSQAARLQVNAQRTPLLMLYLPCDQRRIVRRIEKDRVYDGGREEREKV